MNADELGAHLDRLTWVVGLACGALARYDEQGDADALNQFLDARRQAQALARALPIAPGADGGMDLSQLTADARASVEHLVARLGGLFFGVERGNVSWKLAGVGRKGDA